MEESKQVTVSPQPTPAGTFNLKIENTTYVVGVHFSKTAKGHFGGQNEAFDAG